MGMPSPHHGPPGHMMGGPPGGPGHLMQGPPPGAPGHNGHYPGPPQHYVPIMPAPPKPPAKVDNNIRACSERIILIWCLQLSLFPIVTLIYKHITGY